MPTAHLSYPAGNHAARHYDLSVLLGCPVAVDASSLGCGALNTNWCDPLQHVTTIQPSQNPSFQEPECHVRGKTICMMQVLPDGSVRHVLAHTAWSALCIPIDRSMQRHSLWLAALLLF